MTQKEPRNAGLDLYRIAAAYLITMIHMFGYNSPLEQWSPGSAYTWYLSGVYALNLIGINGFIIISCYFLAGQRFRLRKLVAFVLELQFVTVLISLAWMVINRRLAPGMLVRSVFPILTQHYWYPACYVFLVCLSPFLNKALEKLSGKELLGFIGVLCGGFAFFMTNPFYDGAAHIGHPTHGMIWFILIYAAAYYLRHFELKYEKWLGWPLFLCCYVILFFLKLTEGRLPGMLGLMELYGNDTILAFGLLISSFVIFRRLPCRVGAAGQKLLGLLIPATWILYLLQEHEGVRGMLWQLADVSRFQYTAHPIASALLCQGLVFAALMAVSVLVLLFYRLARRLFLGKLEELLSFGRE